MAKSDKLITYAYLREEVGLPQNIPDEELEYAIYKSQETLRMLLCDEFYRDLLSNYKADTMSDAYNALYNPYIKQYVAWQAYVEWIFEANFKKTRSGIRVHVEPNSTAASDLQVGTILKKYKYDAQYYKNLMMDYLKGHSADYLLYCSCGSPELTGNSFQISAVRNKHKQPEPYGTRGSRKSCR